MVRSRCSLPRPALLVVLILLILATAIPAVSAGSAGSCSIASCIGSLQVSPAGTAPVQGPVSTTYVPPPGTMPVVILQGTPYEMGYQYGLEAPEYIALVRDAAWATALSKNSYADIADNCSISRAYIESDLTKFDVLAYFQGISDAMNDQGISFSLEDVIVMSYYGGRSGPVPGEHCTEFVAFGNATRGGGLVGGVNFDYYQVPANSYQVLLALYPENGYAAILPSGAGRTGSNAVVNENGLIYFLSTAPSDGPGDNGPGISGFLELPYVGMTAASVPEAEQTLLALTRANSLNRMLADTAGHAEVLEATRVRSAIRYPGNGSYLVATNVFFNASMKPSQKVWDAQVYYPSAYYRYITAGKMITDNTGTFSYDTARRTLALTDWWDGRAWHPDDPWSGNTISRFRPDNVASVYSFIVMPDEHTVSVCTGNPAMPFWGSRAPGQTGTYINYTISSTPGEMVYRLRMDADAAFWKTLKVMDSSPDSAMSELYTEAEERYWEAVWWHNRAVLEKDRTRQAVSYGKAATLFSEAIAKLQRVQERAGIPAP